MADVGNLTAERGAPVDVCALAELDDGAVRSVVVGRRTLGLARVGDRVHAFNSVCPHRAGPLGVGRLACEVDAEGPGEPIVRPDACVLLCPWHAWEFSLEDGTAVADPRVRMRIYDAEVCDGRVYVSFARRSAEG